MDGDATSAPTSVTVSSTGGAAPGDVVGDAGDDVVMTRGVPRRRPRDGAPCETSFEAVASTGGDGGDSTGAEGDRDDAPGAAVGNAPGTSGADGSTRGDPSAGTTSGSVSGCSDSTAAGSTGDDVVAAGAVTAGASGGRSAAATGSGSTAVGSDDRNSVRGTSSAGASVAGEAIGGESPAAGVAVRGGTDGGAGGLDTTAGASIPPGAERNGSVHDVDACGAARSTAPVVGPPVGGTLAKRGASRRVPTVEREPGFPAVGGAAAGSATGEAGRNGRTVDGALATGAAGRVPLGVTTAANVLRDDGVGSVAGARTGFATAAVGSASAWLQVRMVQTAVGRSSPPFVTSASASRGSKATTALSDGAASSCCGSCSPSAAIRHAVSAPASGQATSSWSFSRPGSARTADPYRSTAAASASRNWFRPAGGVAERDRAGSRCSMQVAASRKDQGG